jgi:hypothetical protein
MVRLRSSSTLLLLVTLAAAANAMTSTPFTALRSRVALRRAVDIRAMDEDEDDKKDASGSAPSLADRLNRILDTPLFDPTAASKKGEPKLLTSFKDLVDTDYQLAEAVYACLVFSVLLFFSQQAVRIYKHVRR